MSYQVISLGNLSGGLNENDPPTRVAENQASRLTNFEYMDNNSAPQTRRGTAFLARFTALPIGAFALTLNGTQSNIMVITHTAGTLTFWGQGSSESSFTSRGTVSGNATQFVSCVANDLLILASGGMTPPQKWTGTGNRADLGGTPPTTVTALCSWNNRVFAVSSAEPYTIEYCKLGDAEDWTDADPVAGSGFIEMTTGDDRITNIVAQRERLIIFRENSIWQIITALPNTDPGGWRMELLSNRGGSYHKYTIKPFGNDIVFHSLGNGFQSLAAVTEFGDFKSTTLSESVNADSFDSAPTTNPAYAGVAENKCLFINVEDSSEALCMEMMRGGQIRWSRFIFRQNSTSVPNVAFANDGLIYGAKPKVMILYDGVAGNYDLAYWPNNETDDDRWSDHVGGPDGAVPFTTFCETRAWDGGSLIEQKQAIDVGIAFDKLSSTGFNAIGDLVLNIFYDESITNLVAGAFLSDAAATTTHHVKRMRLTTKRRFHSIHIRFSTFKAGLGIKIKDFDVRVTQASRAFHDTVAEIPL